mgnify:CR=1 FL=1
MGRITLQPLIDLYSEYGYSIYKNEDSYVLMQKESDKVMIPKYEENAEEYLSTLELKINRLLKQETDTTTIEKLKFERDVLKLSAENEEDRLSFRIPDVKEISLELLKGISNKLHGLASEFWSIVKDPQFPNKINFLQTTKGSFVLNVALPRRELEENAPLIPGHDKNEQFVEIIENGINGNFETILDNLQNNINVKPLVWKLREFSEEVLSNAEVYSTNRTSFRKIIRILDSEEKKEALNSIRELEESIVNKLSLPSKEFTVLSNSNAAWNRISKVKLLTSLDSNTDVEFHWSNLSWEDLKYIKEKDIQDMSIILKNIQFIKLRNYYRILSAELERAH